MAGIPASTPFSDALLSEMAVNCRDAERLAVRRADRCSGVKCVSPRPKGFVSADNVHFSSRPLLTRGQEATMCHQFAEKFAEKGAAKAGGSLYLFLPGLATHRISREPRPVGKCSALSAVKNRLVGFPMF
jgi:hypothetical protein